MLVVTYPVDALAPVLPQTRSLGEVILQTGGQDNLARADRLGGVVGVGGGDDEAGGIAASDLGDGAVGQGDSVIVGNLLASSVAVPCGSDACFVLETNHENMKAI